MVDSSMRNMLLLLMLLICIPKANATESYSPFSIPNDIPHTIILNGEIDIRSALAFKRALSATPDVKILVLNSPGGLVQNGLLIAEEVHEKGIATFIPDEYECSSACAFIFFAGVERLAEGKLGVHQMSGGNDTAGTQLNISDAIETLNKYGVDPRIFPIMFRTMSSDIHYFSEDEKKSYNINKGFDNMPPPESQTKSPAATPEIKNDRVLAFEKVEELIASNALDNKIALKYAAYSYHTIVRYFGKQTSYSDVMKDKVGYFDRWPIRSYKINYDTISVMCKVDLCGVSGEYSWQVKSPKRNKQSSGTATFSYILDVKNNFKIVSEDGKARK